MLGRKGDAKEAAMAAERTLKVGVGGFGGIGLPVARWLAAGQQGLELAAASARNVGRAKDKLATFGSAAPVVNAAW